MNTRPRFSVYLVQLGLAGKKLGEFATKAPALRCAEKYEMKYEDVTVTVRNPARREIYFRHNPRFHS